MRSQTAKPWRAQNQLDVCGLVACTSPPMRNAVRIARGVPGVRRVNNGLELVSSQTRQRR
jgi:hypothetical protein